MDELAEEVAYDPSEYHIDPMQPKAGKRHKPRNKRANICPSLPLECSELRAWLADAFRKGNVSKARNQRFPSVVWYKYDGILFEGRITNGEQGIYHGYPLDPGCGPKVLNDSQD